MSSRVRYQVSNTYRDLKDELLAVVLGLNGVENGREVVTVELHCSLESDRVLKLLLTPF